MTIEALSPEAVAEEMTPAEMAQEIARLHALLEGKSQYVDCCCTGCPRKIPEVWISGMCQPCCDEDCEHTDGGRAAAAELATTNDLNENQRATIARLDADLDVCRADLAAAIEERERLRGELAAVNEEAAAYFADARDRAEERDRLRAVLAEAVALLHRYVDRLPPMPPTSHDGDTQIFLAGLEPTDDDEPEEGPRLDDAEVRP